MKLLAPGLGTAAALWLLRKTMQKVPFTGRLHFVFVPACVERALGANALDGEAHDYARCTAVCVFFTKKKGYLYNEGSDVHASFGCCVGV